MDILKQNKVEFVTFLLEKDANQWWMVYVECWSLTVLSLTWEQFYALFLEKYVPRSLDDHKKDVCLALEQRDISVVAYEAKFYALCRYSTQLLTYKEERICLYIKV